MRLLMKFMVLRVAEALIDWVGPGMQGDDRISRVILAVGMGPVAVRGTKADVDSAARNLANQVKDSVMVLELIGVVEQDKDHVKERN